MRFWLGIFAFLLSSCLPLCSQSQPAAGATKVNPKDELTYVWVPPGKFRMGCSPGDTECFDPEKSPWQVTVSPMAFGWAGPK